MAYVSSGDGESWSEAALANTIVLRRILSYLPFNSLKECSLVNRLWNFEARSYMRDFRRCDAKICERTPCASLHMLDQLVAQMSVVPMNSITMKLGLDSHVNTLCVEQTTSNNLYNNLLNKLPLRHLDLGVNWNSPDEELGDWDPSNGPQDCPAIKFMLDLLQHKLSELESLTFDSFPSLLWEHLGPDWSPLLPKLKVFDVASIKRMDHQVGFLQKIIEGCPNLTKLKGYFDPEFLGILPEEKYNLLDSFRLYITSTKDENECLKLAKAKPRLTTLFLQAPYQDHEHQFQSSFFKVTEHLLSSSWETLVELSMNVLISPLNRLAIPALVNLKTLDLTAIVGAQQFLNTVNSIDYCKQMPRLKEVIVALGVPVYRGNDLGQPLFPHLEIPVYTGQPSISVEKLVLGFNVTHVSLEYFGRLFPNVKEIEVIPRTVDSSYIPYEALWSCWAHLHSIFVVERRGSSRRNFDAEFLGVHPEEANILQHKPEEFLDQLNLVPVRPCILTLLELKSFRIDFEQLGLPQAGEQQGSAEDAFLSKATGILAIKRLRKMGVSLRFMNAVQVPVIGRDHQPGFTVTVTEGQF